jgi:hypothetical protein
MIFVSALCILNWTSEINLLWVSFYHLRYWPKYQVNRAWAKQSCTSLIMSTYESYYLCLIKYLELIVIIIIIICHELGLNRPFSAWLIVSSRVFQVVFVHLVYNSALLLSSCCCSFLFHVAGNLVCIFLVSRQLVLFSPLPKFPHSCCECQGVYPSVLNNFISVDVSRFYHFAWGSKFHFNVRRMRSASALYIFILEDFWTKVGLNVLFRIPSIWTNLATFLWKSFSFL